MIILIIIVLIILLGRYTIFEGQRIEEHKKFMENLRRMDEYQMEKKRKEITKDYDDGVCEGEYIHPKTR